MLHPISRTVAAITIDRALALENLCVLMAYNRYVKEFTSPAMSHDEARIPECSMGVRDLSFFCGPLLTWGTTASASLSNDRQGPHHDKRPGALLGAQSRSSFAIPYRSIILSDRGPVAASLNRWPCAVHCDSINLPCCTAVSRETKSDGERRGTRRRAKGASAGRLQRDAQSQALQLAGGATFPKMPQQAPYRIE